MIDAIFVATFLNSTGLFRFEKFDNIIRQISLDDLSYLLIKKCCCFGCNGAIGAAFVDVFKRIESIETIACFSRSEKIFDDKIIHCFFDYNDEQSIIDAKVGIDSSIKFDLICYYRYAS